MEKIRVGIPRALLYYNYKTLWLEFFKELNVDVVLSAKTNKETIENGSKYIVDEACLSLKIFIGHVDYLKDKVDYIFIPRIACVKQNEKLCTNYLAIYDLVNNIFSNLKILHYNLDVEEKNNEIDGFIKIGRELGFSYMKVLKAYDKAKEQEKIVLKNKLLKNEQKLKKDKIKILVASHNYNLFDEYIGVPVIEYLEKQNISVITTDVKISSSEDISKTIYWTFNKDIMRAIKYYQKHIDGIVILSTFPCGPDSLCNELIIRKIKDVPISYITIDNNSSDTGLITRLESFVDILKLKKEVENK